VKPWNPFRSSYARTELLCELMGIDGDAPTTAWGWLTQLGRCVAVTALCVGVALTLCVIVCGGGAR
jgi:hypothetical protein